MGPLYSEYFYKRAVATIANINVPSTIRELSIPTTSTATTYKFKGIEKTIHDKKTMLQHQ